MTMFSDGAFDASLFDDSDNDWGVLQKHYQSDKQTPELDTSGLNSPVSNQFASGEVDYRSMAPDEISQLYDAVPQWTRVDSPGMNPSQKDPFAAGVDPVTGETIWANTVGDQLSDTFDPNSLTSEMYKTLKDLFGSYGFQSDELMKLAELFQDNTHLSQLEDAIAGYAFDADRYRDQAQAAIEQNSQDIAQQTIGQLIAAGQLGSSVGQNYLQGNQAKYLTGALSQLEDRIKQYEDLADSKIAAGYESLYNKEEDMKSKYADIVNKALSLKTEGNAKLFDGLTQLMNNEINWDTFLANYTEGEAGAMWGDYSITGEDFNQIGTEIDGVMHDAYGTPWDTPIDQGNGYAVIKSAVGTDQYSLTYTKNGSTMFTYTFDKNDNYGDVARALWNKFDDGMKDIWGNKYFTDEPAPTPSPGPDPTPGDNFWDAEDFALTSSQAAQLGNELTTFVPTVPKDWKEYTLEDGSTILMKRVVQTSTTGGTATFLSVKDPATGDTRYTSYNAYDTDAEIGENFFNVFKEVLGDHWNMSYGWGY